MRRWLETFLDEKGFGYVDWEIEDSTGETHMIDSDVVIEAILNAPEHEQAKVKQTLVKIDFVNASIEDYFQHLAKCLVWNY